MTSNGVIDHEAMLIGECITAFNAGDATAFDAIYDTAKHRLRSYVNQLCWLHYIPEYEQDDLHQELLLKIFLNLQIFKEDKNFFTWAYTIAKNIAIDRNRKLKGRGKEVIGAYEHFPIEYITETELSFEFSNSSSDAHFGIIGESFEVLTQTPEDYVDKYIMLEWIMQYLPETKREVIQLSLVDGLDYKEIAEKLDIPEATVRTRLFHTRKLLSKIIEDDIYETGNAMPAQLEI